MSPAWVHGSPHVENLALPKSLRSGNFTLDKAVIRSSDIGRIFMRVYALAIAAAALCAFPTSTFSQGIEVPGVEIGPGGVRIGRERASHRECEELRLACLHKEELGEEGEGNCRRYRETCRR
jgi:hypothetical protein